MPSLLKTPVPPNRFDRDACPLFGCFRRDSVARYRTAWRSKRVESRMLSKFESNIRPAELTSNRLLPVSYRPDHYDDDDYETSQCCDWNQGIAEWLDGFNDLCGFHVVGPFSPDLCQSFLTVFPGITTGEVKWPLIWTASDFRLLNRSAGSAQLTLLSRPLPIPKRFSTFGHSAFSQNSGRNT